LEGNIGSLSGRVWKQNNNVRIVRQVALNVIE